MTSCGFPFRLKERFAVFADWDGSLAVVNCQLKTFVTLLNVENDCFQDF